MKKTIILIGLLSLLAGLARAETKISICVPLFGIPGTYVSSTEYVVHDGPMYCPPPPPPRHYWHHRHMLPPPPLPPRHFHRSPPPPPPPHHGGHHPSHHFKR